MTQAKGDLIGAEGITFTSIDDLVWLAENSPDAALDGFGNRPIHYAAKYGSIDAITKMIELGADPTLTNFNDERASDLARSAGYIAVALALRGHEREASGLANGTQVTSGKKSQKNSGDFSPTPATNLLNTDSDWDLPDVLAADESDRSSSSEMNKINRELNLISDSISTESNIMLWCLYSRIKDLFENIHPLLNELEKTGSSLLDYNDNIDLFDGYFHPFQEIIELIDEKNSENKFNSELLKEIYEICNYEVNTSDLVGAMAISIQKNFSQKVMHISNVVLMISSFSELFDGDLFDNRESGDQDLLNPNIKLVPPVFEATEKFERYCEQFFDDWGRNFVESTKWDHRHWVLPD